MNQRIEQFEKDLCLRDGGKSEINRGQARELRKIISGLLREGGMELVRILIEQGETAATRGPMEEIAAVPDLSAEVPTNVSVGFDMDGNKTSEEVVDTPRTMEEMTTTETPKPKPVTKPAKKKR